MSKYIIQYQTFIKTKEGNLKICSDYRNRFLKHKNSKDFDNLEDKVGEVFIAKMYKIYFKQKKWNYLS